MTTDTTGFTGRSRPSRAYGSAGFGSRASGGWGPIAALALAALVPPTPATAQETHADDLLTVGHYLRHGARRRSADLPRRDPDHLHPVVGEQAGGPVRLGAPDHGRGRHAAALSADGLESTLVAGRDANRLPGAGRPGQTADPCALDGRRGRHHSGHPRERVPHQLPVVARRDAHLLPAARAPLGPVADRPSPASGGRAVDPRAARHRPDPLPLRPDRLPRRGLRPSLPGSRRRRHRAAANRGAVECGRFLRPGRRQRGLRPDPRRGHPDLRRPHGGHRQPLPRIAHPGDGPGRRRHPPTDLGAGSVEPAAGVPRRQSDRLHRLPLDLPDLQDDRAVRHGPRRRQRTPRLG